MMKLMMMLFLGLYPSDVIQFKWYKHPIVAESLKILQYRMTIKQSEYEEAEITDGLNIIIIQFLII